MGVLHVQHGRLHSDHTHKSAVSLQPPAAHRVPGRPSPAHSHPPPPPTHPLQHAGKERVNVLSRCSQAKRVGEGWISDQVESDEERLFLIINNNN